MAHRDYYNDRDEILKYNWFKSLWVNFWYEWISFGQANNGEECGYHKFRTLRLVSIVFVIVLILALRMI